MTVKLYTLADYADYKEVIDLNAVVDVSLEEDATTSDITLMLSSGKETIITFKTFEDAKKKYDDIIAQWTKD